MMEKRKQVFFEHEVMSGDFITPIEVFNTFYNDPEYSHTNFLESVVENAVIGRYSFITVDYIEEIVGYTDSAIVSNAEGTKRYADPLSALRTCISSKIMNLNDDDMPVFAGGYIGYFSFETMGLFENIAFKKSSYPIFHFVLPRAIIAFDNIYQKLHIISLGFSEDEASYFLRIIKQRLLKRSPLQPISEVKMQHIFEREYDKKEFEHIVDVAKRYIYDGDIFQTVLSQSLKVRGEFMAINVYRRLRGLNPSPYMFFINMPETTLIGSSPEILVKKVGSRAVLRPIAGTRPRGATAEQDKALEEDLLSDEKELAEHNMLVDLARNDLGRVCEFGSVKVSEYKKIEKYSHVMHIVSEVSGEVSSEHDALDLFLSAFPAGTVSGAPKIRAVEIINELEKTPRGPYAGAVGYFDFSGNMDFCITIRTIMKRNDEFVLRAGAGIVYDSVPEREYEETLNKARALMQIL